MRRLLLLVGLLAFLCNPTLAGKNAGGAMVVHTDDTINYTFFAPPDYCAIFPYDGDDCTALNATSNFVDPNFLLGALVYYVAAFPPDSSPGVTVVFFGHDHNFATGFISGWSFCGPPNSLEIPDGGWPEALSAGNSVAFGSAVTGDPVFPFYWLGVYGDVGNYIGPRINPTGGYAGFVSDDNPGVLDECSNFGTLRWDPEMGTNDCPVAAPEGACCFDNGTCAVLTLDQCETAVGDYQGDDTLCDPNPCPQPGACCLLDGTCTFILEELCLDGRFIPETACDPNPCPQPGACCFPDGACEYVQEEECATGDFTPETTCDPNPCPQPGACCLDDGTCLFVIVGECDNAGGTFLDEGVPCEPNPCQQPEGACCVAGESCLIMTETECLAQGGQYLGDDIACIPNPCPFVCCFSDGSCSTLTEDECIAGGGEPREDLGDFCDPNPCPQPPVEGACCFVDGSCQVMAAQTCVDAGGAFQGEDSVCDPNPCPQPGACCFTDGSCEYILEELCQGDSFIVGTTCDPNPCPQPPPMGACCYPDGSCQYVVEADCSTGDWRVDVVCDPNPCPQPPVEGACCFVDGSCQVMAAQTCVDAGGAFQGEDSVCDPNPCPQPGACCFTDGSCEYILEELCQGDSFIVGTTCDPNPCPQPPPMGACCYPDGSCEYVAEDNCPTGDWRIGVLCDPNPCPPPGQEFIRGDVNADGIVDVLDTHYFMIASRMPDPPCLDATDFNDDGIVDRDDLLALIDYAILGGSPPPPPYPQCGIDPTDDALDCLSFPPCEERAGGIGLLDVVSLVEQNGWIELSASISSDGSRLYVPVTVHAIRELLSIDASLSFDPAALRFVGLDRHGVGLTTAGAARDGHLDLGAWSDMRGTAAIGAGEASLGRLVFEIRDPSRIEGSRVEIIDGRLLASDRTYSEIRGGEITIDPGDRVIGSMPVSEPSVQIPNPIRPNSVISLTLPQGAPVAVVIYNVHGQKIRTLLNRDLSSGRHEVIWDGKTDTGQNAGPGIYYVNATIGRSQIDRKVVLVR